jgi:hypothetical protein
MSIVVDAVYLKTLAVAVRFSPRNECPKIITPFSVNGNSPSSVSGKVFGVWAFASMDHRAEHSVETVLFRSNLNMSATYFGNASTFDRAVLAVFDLTRKAMVNLLSALLTEDVKPTALLPLLSSHVPHSIALEAL